MQFPVDICLWCKINSHLKYFSFVKLLFICLTLHLCYAWTSEKLDSLMFQWALFLMQWFIFHVPFKLFQAFNVLWSASLILNRKSFNMPSLYKTIFSYGRTIVWVHLAWPSWDAITRFAQQSTWIRSKLTWQHAIGSMKLIHNKDSESTWSFFYFLTFLQQTKLRTVVLCLFLFETTHMGSMANTLQ